MQLRTFFDLYYAAAGPILQQHPHVHKWKELYRADIHHYEDNHIPGA